MSPPLSTVRQIGGGGGGERALLFPEKGTLPRPSSVLRRCVSVSPNEGGGVGCMREGLLRHSSLPPPPAKAKEDHLDCV